MLVKTVTVKNFRCAKGGVLNCEKLTALVGANGSGKSTFLRALQLFYDTNPKIDQRDWYNEDQNEPLEISITFSDLGSAEKQKFGSYLTGNELTVERVFLGSESKVQNKYYGARLGVPEFKAVRSESSAAAIKRTYQALIECGRYAGLAEYSNKEQAFEALKQWEQEHLDQCSPTRDEGQFFGFTGVAQGYLGTFTKLIYVPAVRDAGSDADEGKDSPVKEIIDLVVRNSLAAHKQILQLKADTKRRYDEIVDPRNLSGLRTLQEQLNETLRTYVLDAMVELDWLPTSEVQLALPKTDVMLSEDGYPCTVSRSGHGLQRAFILTMLQHLAITNPIVEENQEGTSNESSREATATGEAREQCDLILCIEEPEVYQHPNRQRHFASILLNLASGTIAGVARKTQVIYSTHSPMFVGLDRFDQVRVFRKVVAEQEKPKCTQLAEVTMDRIAEQLWNISECRGPQFTAETLIPRLQPIMTPWVNEGFFADVVVLVEGEDDLAAIQGTAKSRDLSLDALGISVIPCGGKNNLDRPALIFKALGIPTYIVWDSDRGDQNGVETNKRLLRLLGEREQDYPSAIKDKFACFESKLEQTLKQELGEQLFERITREVQGECGAASPNDCLKRPLLFSELIRRARMAQASSKSLSDILDKILVLQKPREPVARLATASSAPTA
jgi:putative ATP-dependent endonuclease of OLD family